MPQLDIDDLVEGNDYCFRVQAENEAGLSPSADIGPITAKIPYGMSK